MDATPATHLVLFVARGTPRSVLAIENIARAIERHMERSFALDIVDVYDDPERALNDRVLVTPTLLAPACARRLIGDLGAKTHLDYFLTTLPRA